MPTAAMAAKDIQGQGLCDQQMTWPAQLSGCSPAHPCFQGGRQRRALRLLHSNRLHGAVTGCRSTAEGHEHTRSGSCLARASPTVRHVMPDRQQHVWLLASVPPCKQEDLGSRHGSQPGIGMCQGHGEQARCTWPAAGAAPADSHRIGGTQASICCEDNSSCRHRGQVEQQLSCRTCCTGVDTICLMLCWYKDSRAWLLRHSPTSPWSALRQPYQQPGRTKLC